MNRDFELASCPFCYDDKVFTKQQGDLNEWNVQCGCCSARGPREWTEQEAIKSWNTIKEI